MSIPPALHTGDPEAAAALDALGIEVTLTRGPSGVAPVRAEGTIADHRWYLRCNGERATLEVAADPGSYDALEDQRNRDRGWRLPAKVAEWPAADRLPRAEALGCIARGLLLWAWAQPGVVPPVALATPATTPP